MNEGSLSSSHSKSSVLTQCAVCLYSEPGAVYEVKLVAYNGNGDSDGSTRLVSLVEEKISDSTSGEDEHTVG